MKIFFWIAVILFAIGATTAYFLGIMPTSLGVHSKIYKSSSVAMDGYDMTSYILNKKANKGDVTFNYKFKETNWFFTSKRNKKAFTLKPSRYIPKFGGYCTYTMSKGFTYPPDPKVWHFYKGKLYFFKDKETKELALSDWENVLANAELHW